MNYKDNNRNWNRNNYNQNYDSRPNQARFENFTLLEDETGFTIPNCNHIFYFDQNGGWFDEFGNYYNANGEPSAPPENDSADDYHAADDWANEYEDDYDDGDRDDLAHYDKVFLNVENKRVLQTYLKEENVEVEIRNLNFKKTEDDFENFLVKSKIEWIEFEFEYDDRDRFNGTCYVVLDKINAEKLIEFNGSKVFDRDIKITILKKESEEDIEDAHEIGAGINLEDVKKVAEEHKAPEKEKVFQRSEIKSQDVKKSVEDPDKVEAESPNTTWSNLPKFKKGK